MAILKDEVSRLANSLGERPEDLDTREQFEAWVRDAVDEIYLEDWNFNIGSNSASVPALTESFNPGVDVQRISSIIRTDLTEHLKFVTWEWLLTSRLDPELIGSSSHWYINHDLLSSSVNTFIGFWPRPVAVMPILIRYKKTASSFDTDDAIPIHSALLPAMREHVKSSYYGDDPQRQEQYEARLTRYTQLLEKAKSVINSQSTPRPGSRWTDLAGARIEPNFIVPDQIPIS